MYSHPKDPTSKSAKCTLHLNQTWLLHWRKTNKQMNKCAWELLKKNKIKYLGDLLADRISKQKILSGSEENVYYRSYIWTLKFNTIYIKIYIFFSSSDLLSI